MERRLGAAGSRTAARTVDGAADPILGGQREAGGSSAGHTDARGDLHQALYGARLDRPVLRGRRIQGRQADGVDPFAGCVSAEARPRQGVEARPRRGSLCARRRLGLLRTQRRRRRGPRCRTLSPRGSGAAGASAMDARRRVRLGAVWLGDAGARQGLARAKRARSSTGSTRCGATPTAPGRPHLATTTIFWPAGMSPSRASRDRRSIFPSRRVAATATRCRFTIFPISGWSIT